MNLESMPQPVRMSEKCSLDQLPNFQKAGGSDVKMVSLFEQKRLKGFWPVYDEVGGVRQLTVTIAYAHILHLTCLPGHPYICLVADGCCGIIVCLLWSFSLPYAVQILVHCFKVTISEMLQILDLLLLCEIIDLKTVKS